MRKFIIEREIQGVGGFTPAQMAAAAAKSNAALAQLAPDVQWVQSYVAAERTFCVYLAKDTSAIRRHAALSGFPANRVVEITAMMDPATASSAVGERAA